MYNNNYQNPNIKEYYKQFYYNNKPLVYMMAASLILLLIAGENFFSIFYYVYLIYIGGFFYKQYSGDYKLLSMFLMSGLLGLALFATVFSEMVFSVYSLSAFAGSASIGLLTAAATKSPNVLLRFVFFGNVKLKWIAIVLIGLDMLTIGSAKGFNNVSHLAAIAYAFFSEYFSYFNGFKIPKFGKKKGPFYEREKSHDKTRKETDAEYNKRKEEERKEIDKILEKVKNKGYEGLSAEEKRKLFDKSSD